MDDNGRFGFDPDDFDRVFRDASEGLRDAFEGVSRFFICPATGPDGLGPRRPGPAHADQAGNRRRGR